MDVQYPYADGLSRRQLLYRLPTAPAPRRLLVVHADADGALIGGGWDGPVTAVSAADLPTTLAQGDTRFEAVALPSVLAQGDGALRRRLLDTALNLLVPGGAVVGHVEHACALRRWGSAAGLRAVFGALRGADGVGSARQCLETLQRAGFVDAATFYVQPSIDAPMGLIPSDPVAARAHFLRAIRSARHSYGLPGYALRLALARAGLGGTLQPQLFFWARRPC